MKKLGLVFYLILVISGSYIFGQSKITLSERILNNSIQTTLDSCPVGPAANPYPPDGAINISSLYPGFLSWENGANTTSIDINFGLAGNLYNVYSGTPITSLGIPPPLPYFRNFQWQVICKNDTCSSVSTIWNFRTEQDPSIVTWFDDFEFGPSNWIITNDGGNCVWQIYNYPYPNLYTFPGFPTGTSVFAADADNCGMGTTLFSTATISTPFNFSQFAECWIEFDNDWQAFDSTSFGYIEVSTDSINWQIARTYNQVDVRSSHEIINISSFIAYQPTVYIRLRSIQPGWHWWWAIDNFQVNSIWIPVELTSFTSSVEENNVTLNWQTATETNNSGFDIERNTPLNPLSRGEAEGRGVWSSIGFVNGNGTTTEPQSYSFVDKELEAGKYQYRLTQIDFDGTFEYSNVIEVEINPPAKFGLEQNYPNPFNPLTTIKFSIPSVGTRLALYVQLKVYDVLGKEVATLVNEEKPAGSYEVEFDASNLASGIYYYQIRVEEYTAT